MQLLPKFLQRETSTNVYALQPWNRRTDLSNVRIRADRKSSTIIREEKHIKLYNAYITLHWLHVKITLEIAWNFGTDRSIPFFEEFPIACPLRAVNSRIKGQGKTPVEKARRTDETQLLGERFGNVLGQFIIRHRTTRSHHRRVHNITLCFYTTSANTMLDYPNTRSIKPPPPWALSHSRYAISTDRFDLTGCSLIDNSQQKYIATGSNLYIYLFIVQYHTFYNVYFCTD